MCAYHVDGVEGASDVSTVGGGGWFPAVYHGRDDEALSGNIAKGLASQGGTNNVQRCVKCVRLEKSLLGAGTTYPKLQIEPHDLRQPHRQGQYISSTARILSSWSENALRCERKGIFGPSIEAASLPCSSTN